MSTTATKTAYWAQNTEDPSMYAYVSPNGDDTVEQIVLVHLLSDVETLFFPIAFEAWKDMAEGEGYVTVVFAGPEPDQPEAFVASKVDQDETETLLEGLIEKFAEAEDDSA